MTSYGGRLSYTIYYSTGRYPAQYIQPGPDVIISVSASFLVLNTLTREYWIQHITLAAETNLADGHTHGVTA